MKTIVKLTNSYPVYLQSWWKIFDDIQILVSSIKKTDHHAINEILLNMVLNTITSTLA